MNIKESSGRNRTNPKKVSLVELLRRARQSKHITGDQAPPESAAALAAYKRLGKIAGR